MADEVSKASVDRLEAKVKKLEKRIVELEDYQKKVDKVFKEAKFMLKRFRTLTDLLNF